MEFYDEYEKYNGYECGCDDHCGSDGWGCDSCSCDVDD